MMKVKVAAVSDIEKDCVLFLDEMEIRKGVELDRSGDGFLGKTTLPETDQAANHVLVFMVGGLNKRWKQVIAYHFMGGFVNGEKSRDFVFHLFRLCADISLRVLCVTCDMGSSNRAMWRSLNLSSSRYSVTTCAVPNPCDNAMSLFFMADPSHVLKNVRGHLVRKDPMQVSDEIVAKYNLPSRVVSIEYVKAVLKLDAEQLKVAPNLSTLHVSNGHFTKMKVGVAVQLFREAPAAIRYLVERKELPPEAGTTAWFFETIFKWGYTIRTARHHVVSLSLLNKIRYEEAISTLKLAVEVVESLGIGIKKVWKPCQAGVVMSTAVVLQLHDILLKKRGYTFFVTGRLAQDCLENLFSVIRMISSVPRAYDVKNALKIVSVSQLLKVPKNSGYEADDSNNLVDFFSREIQDVRAEFQDPLDADDCAEVEPLSPVESDIVAHLAGYLVKPFISANKPCSSCIQTLTADEHALVQLKEYKQGSRNLVYVSGTVLHFVSS
ncbi:hypothetical protein HPB49_004016 [Dermacentor silvarum]|uniref:Uncharacterized protein n=1 Tax=Dermacentor silvarum TaxID=543639 RepID=A0ACB8DMD1_DERSI|nr:hypothetical protein HPB49_004016 [Dermacentor silvarum]